MLLLVGWQIYAGCCTCGDMHRHLQCLAQVAAPTTLVMDLEGSDGRERGEDDTSFERQVSEWVGG